MNDIERVVALQEAAAKAAGIKGVKELLAHNRELYVCKARDTAIYLARETTSLSWERLAAMFGARHHTSLIMAHRRVKMRLARGVKCGTVAQVEWNARILEAIQPQVDETKVGTVEVVAIVDEVKVEDQDA
jgi:chromosomal replication initiation ATPase DnaA